MMKAMLVLAAAAALGATPVAASACAPAHHARAAYHPLRRHYVHRADIHRAAVRTVYVTRVVRVPVAYPVRVWAPPPRPYPVEYRHHWRHEDYEGPDARFDYPRDDWRADVYRY